MDYDAGAADFGLMASSPCINNGDNDCEPTPTDLAGGARMVGIIDRGAYEYGINLPTSIVAISENAEDLLSVYPNPASTYFTVEVPQTGGTLTLTNYMGRTVQKQYLTDNISQVSTQALPPGLYQATYRKGEITAAKKIVVR